MSIPQLSNSMNTAPLPPLSPVGSAAPAVRPPALGPIFDRFQSYQTRPDLSLSLGQKLRIIFRHPLQAMRNLGKAPVAPGEGNLQRLKMMDALRAQLDSNSRDMLNALQKEGVLDDTLTDDGHSTLYHLYAMLTTRRAPGYDAPTLVRETLTVLSKPYLITQQFSPLSENAARRILQVRSNPTPLNRAGTLPPFKQFSWADLDVQHGATCEPSSVMYYMADKEPGELVRQLNELTSPMNAFFEKVKLAEISPDNPNQAFEILKSNQIKYYVSGPGEVTVRVENPPAGVLRAIDSQKVIGLRDKKALDPRTHQPLNNPYLDMRTGVEAAYQSALMFLGTRTYDPAVDLRDSWQPGEGSIGLQVPEADLMETIVTEKGGVQTVTYQIVGGKDNPQPGEEGNNYLYGYNRTFEQILADIMEPLRMKIPVKVGYTDTDENGAVISAHVNTIFGLFTDPKDGELKFEIADSDDNTAAPVVHSVRDILPTIHHISFPLSIARRINREIEGSQQLMVPDQQDASRFNLLRLAQDDSQVQPQTPFPQQQKQFVPEFKPTGTLAPTPSLVPMPPGTPGFSPGFNLSTGSGVPAGTINPFNGGPFQQPA